MILKSQMVKNNIVLKPLETSKTKSNKTFVLFLRK